LTVDESLLGTSEFVNNYLIELDKNNVKYKEIIRLVPISHLLDFQIQLEMDDIIFVPYNFEYECNITDYEFRKNIKYNTIFDFDRFDDSINVLTDKLGQVKIIIYRNDIILDYGSREAKIYFTNFQEFITWLAENMPEYLRPNDIKIALKD